MVGQRIQWSSGAGWDGHWAAWASSGQPQGGAWSKSAGPQLTIPLLSKHTTVPWLSFPILLWIPKSNCKLLYIYRTMFFKYFYFSQTGAMLMLNASPSLQGVMHSPLCDKCAEYNGGTIPGKELWRKGKMLMHCSPQPTQLNWTFGLNQRRDQMNQQGPTNNN